jgi:cellulose synthase/poly-beta-1,6-N-acetylglucosamine synthase-like glycosyltransferase
MGAGPSVSIVVPTFDEEHWIAACLDSLCAQDYGDVVEILVVDGRSNDATRQLVRDVATRDERVRLVDNPRRSAASALNIGLATTKAEIFVRADAHTLYASNYVRRCVEVLLETGADDVGGPMRPAGTTRFGHAVAAVTSSKIGMGGGAFHWTTERRDVDTVFLGCYRTHTLRDLGGWDESNLQWAAEDHELNFRLTQRGGRIVCDPSIVSSYCPRETPAGLWRQYFNYGVGKVSTLRKHRSLPTSRPLAPAALVGALAGGAVVAAVTRRPVAAAPALVYTGAASVAAARLARTSRSDTARCLAALAICHIAYGAGFWSGVGRVARGRPFDRLPRTRR